MHILSINIYEQYTFMYYTHLIFSFLKQCYLLLYKYTCISLLNSYVQYNTRLCKLLSEIVRKIHNLLFRDESFHLIIRFPLFLSNFLELTKCQTWSKQPENKGTCLYAWTEQEVSSFFISLHTFTSNCFNSVSQLF